MHVILGLFTLGFCQNEKSFRQQKLGACLALVRFNLHDLDAEIASLSSFIPIQNQERAQNKIAADMMMSCMEKISSKSAIELLAMGENTMFLPDHKYLLEWNKNQFNDDSIIIFTPEQIRLFEEITAFQDQAQIYEEDQHIESNDLMIDYNLVPFANIGKGYILIVIFTFAVFFYLAISKVDLTSRQVKNAKKTRRNKKK